MTDTASAPRAKRTLPTAAELTLGAALGCSQAWVSMSFMSVNMYAGSTDGVGTLDVIYLASIAVVTLTLALTAVAGQRAEPLLALPATAWILPLGACVSTLLMPASNAAGAVGAAALGISGVGSGLFSGLFLVYIGLTLADLQPRSIVVAVASGQILASVLFAISCLFSPLESCLLAASMPVAAGLLLGFGKREAVWEHEQQPAEASDQAEALLDERERDDPDDLRRMAGLVARIAACALLVGMANEAARTLYVHMSILGVGKESFALTQALAALVVTVGAIAVTLVMANSRIADRMGRTCYQSISLLLMAGILLLPLPLLYPAMGASLPYAINAAAFQCFGLFMFVIVLGMCARYHSRRVRIFASIRAAWAAGPLIGIVVGRTAARASIAFETVLPVMTLGAIAVFLTAVAVFTESHLMQAMDALPLERRRRFREKCAKAARKFKLSEREAQIMVLFAKGRNLPYIQEEMSLSKSTVSTHRQHIYQKMGIHSQQELIDLIQHMG